MTSAWTAEQDSFLELDGFTYVLRRDLVWRLGKPDGPSVVVPAGLRFELSIPRGLRWLINPHGPEFRKAAALHDWMVQTGFDRLTAASQFYAALKADGVKSMLRLVMYLAVAIIDGHQRRYW